MADSWNVAELLERHGAAIRQMAADGKGCRAIAAALAERTGRPCKKDVAYRAMKAAAELAAMPRQWSEPLDVSPVHDADEPLQDLLARRLNHTQRSIRKQQARTKVCRMPAEPFGLAVFGDPHLDDPGCRFDLLMRDLNAAAVPGCYGISLGDHQNHWIGRLMYKHAGQNVTSTEGWRLARWFLNAGDDGSGVDFLAVCGGNHDAWSHTNGIDPYATICAEAGVRYYDDAEVRLRLVFGEEVAPITMLIRHDFPGRSWFHASHGPAKAGLLDGSAELLLAGHLHSWAMLMQEVAGERTPVAIRARGYKHGDEYARQKGFLEQQHGQSCMIVVNPFKSGPARFLTFWDMEAGSDYLQHLRRSNPPG